MAGYVADDSIGRRIDSTKLNLRHGKIVGLVGMATFFDAFDALAIAFVMPVLAVAWHLTPTQIGLTISAGYVGQLIGAVALGWLAERRGRIGALKWAVGIMSVLSLACAAAWSLPALIFARLIQGIGLGGEVPIAATYVNEWSPSHLRGRIVYLFQALFATAVATTALVSLFVIPNWGWRAMFILGAIPGVIFVFFGRKLPESPRWLAANGRVDEASRILDRVEGKATPEAAEVPLQVTEKPPAPRFKDLFANGYWKRTLVAWMILFCTSAVGYGLLTWMPTLYRTVYKLPLDLAFQFSLTNNVVGLFGTLSGALVIDRLGRKGTFTTAFVGAAAPLLFLAAFGATMQPHQIMMVASVSTFFISVMLGGIYVYAPEIYPTRIRALGASTATAWYRVAAIVSPTLVGVLLARADISAVYFYFSAMALVGAAVVAFLAIETRGRRLEEIAA